MKLAVQVDAGPAISIASFLCYPINFLYSSDDRRSVPVHFTLMVYRIFPHLPFLLLFLFLMTLLFFSPPLLPLLDPLFPVLAGKVTL